MKNKSNIINNVVSVHNEINYNNSLQCAMEDINTSRINIKFLSSTIKEHGVTDTIKDLMSKELSSIVDLEHTTDIDVLSKLDNSLEDLLYMVNDTIRKIIDSMKRFIIKITTNLTGVVKDTEQKYLKVLKYNNIKFKSSTKYYLVLPQSLINKKTPITNIELESISKKLNNSMLVFKNIIYKNNWKNTKSLFEEFNNENTEKILTNLNTKKSGVKVYYNNNNINDFIKDCENQIEFSKNMIKQLNNHFTVFKKLNVLQIDYNGNNSELDPLDLIRNFNNIITAIYLAVFSNIYAYRQILLNVVEKK